MSWKFCWRRCNENDVLLPSDVLLCRAFSGLLLAETTQSVLLWLLSNVFVCPFWLAMVTESLKLSGVPNDEREKPSLVGEGEVVRVVGVESEAGTSGNGGGRECWQWWKRWRFIGQHGGNK